MQNPDHILGNTPLSTFLEEYWQQKPLLIRTAIENYASPISADEMAGLACESDVESRIILERDGEHPWQCQYGPFDEAVFAELPATHWILLQQSCNLHTPGFAQLLERCRFIPIKQNHLNSTDRVLNHLTGFGFGLMKFFFIIFSLYCLSLPLYAEGSDKFPIFDAHIHYSHDVWQAISPKDAIRRLREAGVTRAMVSSSSDDGTQRLYEADPEFVIPVLRPYRRRGTLDSWMFDETVIPYLKERLARYRYVAIGEFHVKPEDVNTPVVRQVIKLARNHGLMLHVHGDARSIELIYQQDPDAKILWAHAGFEHAKRVDQVMSRYPNLWADLSFRRDAFGNGQYIGGWRELLIKHADRFMLGIDTYTPQRWLKIKQVMKWQQDLLEGLPKEVAAKIAYQNGQRVIATRFK